MHAILVQTQAVITTITHIEKLFAEHGIQSVDSTSVLSDDLFSTRHQIIRNDVCLTWEATIELPRDKEGPESEVLVSLVNESEAYTENDLILEMSYDPETDLWEFRYYIDEVYRITKKRGPITRTLENEHKKEFLDNTAAMKILVIMAKLFLTAPKKPK